MGFRFGIVLVNYLVLLFIVCLKWLINAWEWFPILFWTCLEISSSDNMLNLGPIIYCRDILTNTRISPFGQCYGRRSILAFWKSSHLKILEREGDTPIQHCFLNGSETIFFNDRFELQDGGILISSGKS